MISASLMTQAEVNRGTILPDNPRPENYVDAWDRANFGQYMWNSTRMTAITIVGLLAFCIPAAYAFARMNFWGKNILFVTMLTTLMIPDIVTLIPNFLTVIWINRFSQALCGEFCAWYDNWPALTVPFMASAFTIFLLRQFFIQIPNDLWDAAQIDGAGHITFLLRVVLPLSRAPIMTVVVFAFIGSWNSLLWPLLVTSPSGHWQPVAAGLSHFVNNDAPSDFQLQMAASVMMVLPILLLYFVAQRQFTEGIASSGLKG
jgi:ABC-type glycerol-3-phosphate transport system permease component